MERTIEIVKYELNSHPSANSDRNYNYSYNVPLDNLKFTDPPTVLRKNASKMSNDEKQAFIDGINFYNVAPATNYPGGNYRQTVAIHKMYHRMHSGDGPVGTQRFLTWHRIYLALLEGDIRVKYNPKFFIPYWDWVNDREIPDFLEDFLPHVHLPNSESPPLEPYTNLNVFRSPGQQGALPTQQQINELFKINTYTDFTTELEYLHNGVHMWVGGTMVDIRTSPADPVFWLHHANIDRIWLSWQASNPGQNPTLSPIDQIMDPWMNLTEPSWRTDNYIGYA